MPTIQELNRYPHTEVGHCWSCGAPYSLTQVRLQESAPADLRFMDVFFSDDVNHHPDALRGMGE